MNPTQPGNPGRPYRVVPTQPPKVRPVRLARIVYGLVSAAVLWLLAMAAAVCLGGSLHALIRAFLWGWHR